MQGLHGCGFTVIHCGETPGQASATKMCYAALTKGTFTLHTALLMAANSLGVYETVIEEFRFSQASVLQAMEKRVPFIPADSERWIGEMEEIANTFRKAGVTGSFHDGAAAVLEVLAKTPFAQETRESLDHTRTLNQAIGADAVVKDHQPGKKKIYLEESPVLSQANTKFESIATRQVAFLVADGFHMKDFETMQKALEKETEALRQQHGSDHILVRNKQSVLCGLINYGAGIPGTPATRGPGPRCASGAPPRPARCRPQR